MTLKCSTEATRAALKPTSPQPATRPGSDLKARRFILPTIQLPSGHLSAHSDSARHMSLGDGAQPLGCTPEPLDLFCRASVEEKKLRTYAVIQQKFMLGQKRHLKPALIRFVSIAFVAISKGELFVTSRGR